jgi:hypothetical protein
MALLSPAPNGRRLNISLAFTPITLKRVRNILYDSRALVSVLTRTNHQYLPSAPHYVKLEALAKDIHRQNGCVTPAFSAHDADLI